MDVSIYRLRHRDILLLCVLCLLLMGIVMVQSASMKVTGVVGWGWTDNGLRHAKFAGVALVTFLVVGRIDYAHMLRGTKTLWRNPILWIVLIAAATCLLVLAFGTIWRMVEFPSRSRILLAGLICFLFAHCIYYDVVFLCAMLAGGAAVAVRR